MQPKQYIEIELVMPAATPNPPKYFTGPLLMYSITYTGTLL